MPGTTAPDASPPLPQPRTELRGQGQADGDRQHAQHQEGAAPAGVLADDAGHRTGQHLRHHHAGQEAADGDLPLRVRHHVAEIGHHQRDGGAGEQAGGGAQQHQHGQSRRTGAGHDEGAVHGQRDRDDAQLAESVAEWAEHDLAEAIRQQEGRDHGGGDSHGNAQAVGNLRQQRVEQPRARAGREAAQREDEDGNRRRGARPGCQGGGCHSGGRQGRARPGQAVEHTGRLNPRGVARIDLRQSNGMAPSRPVTRATPTQAGYVMRRAVRVPVAAGTSGTWSGILGALRAW